MSVVAAEALRGVELANEILAEDNAAPTDLAELLRRARLLSTSTAASASACAPPLSRPPLPQHGDAPRSPGPADPAPIACL